MDEGWEKVRKEVTCSICLTIFMDPKMLPCLHTYCAKCLQMLWQQADTVGVNRTIRCPQCREQVPLSSVEKLPSSFSVSRLVDIVEMQDRLSKEAPPMCQSCSSNTSAVASCTPCGIFLCTPCLDVHKTLKLTSAHQINSLDDIKSGKVTVPSILDHRKEMCSIHPDKPLELYCTQEECLICLGCAVVNHRNHKYDFISQVAKEQKQKITHKLPQFRKQVETIELAAAKLKSIQEQLEKRREDDIHHVDEVFRKLTTALNERKQQLLDEINKITADKIKALNEQHRELTDLQAQMKGYLELIEIKLKSERDQAILAMKDQMINRGDTLLKTARFAKTSPVERVPPKVEFPHLQYVQGLVKLLGISFSNETCKLQIEDELSKLLSANHNKSTFEVIMKDLSGQPVLNCSSILDVKIFPNENCIANVEQPTITDNKNGIYKFSANCKSCSNVRGNVNQNAYRYVGQEIHGLVSVQMFGKDVQGSPLRFKHC